MDYGYKGDGIWGGGLWFALIAIFLVILFAFWRRRDDEGAGGIASLLPAALAMLGNKKNCDEGYGFHHHESVEFAKQQAIDTGKIIHEVDKQGCLTRENQNNLAMIELRERACKAETEVAILKSAEKTNGRLAEFESWVKANLIPRPNYTPFGGWPYECMPRASC